MWLISRNVGKRFVVSNRSPGRTLSTTPSKSYVVCVVTFSNPCRMFAEEFSECPLECHVYSLFIVVGGGHNCLWLVKDVIFTLDGLWLVHKFDWDYHLIYFGHVVPFCGSWMSCHYDKWHEFELQGRINVALELNRVDLIICKAQIIHLTQMHMNIIQISYES